MTNQEEIIVSIIEKVSKSKPIREVGGSQYWDAYVSTNDLYGINIPKSKPLGQFYTVQQLRKICDKIAKTGAIQKVNIKNSGCYARYCMPLSDGWEMHVHNLFRENPNNGKI